jgi:hypothetical protein
MVLKERGKFLMAYNCTGKLLYLLLASMPHVRTRCMKGCRAVRRTQTKRGQNGEQGSAVQKMTVLGNVQYNTLLCHKHTEGARIAQLLRHGTKKQSRDDISRF